MKNLCSERYQAKERTQPRIEHSIQVAGLLTRAEREIKQ